MRKAKLMMFFPSGFYRVESLKAAMARFDRLAKVTRLSPPGDNLYSTARGLDLSDDDPRWAYLPTTDLAVMWSWPGTLTPAMLDRMACLQWSGNIDICKGPARLMVERGIPLSLAKKGWSPAVAEAALAMMLSVFRRITDYNLAMRHGREFWALSDYPGSLDPLERRLGGKSVGIIGYGGIGRRLVELLGPFHCDVRVCDPYVGAPAIEAGGATKATLAQVLRKSDAVVVAAAANLGTKHMIGRREIAMLKPGCLLVNVARARLVDTAALVGRLKKGDIMAAVDVFDAEPAPRNHPLRKLPNAYLMPHRAGGVLDSINLILNWLADDLENHLAGRPLKHGVTREMLPAMDE
jgi:phosphoglycerate dehydrogenase-like enzyme